jgi:hypothetical protein
MDAGRVTDIAWEVIGTGQVGETARFHLTYDPAGCGPATVAAKFPSADPTSRSTAALFSLYAKEVGFYRAVAGLLDVRVPRVYAAEIADNKADFVLLFEDLGPARGGNQLEGCSPADARAAMCQAAALHGPTRGNAAVLGADWLKAADGVAAQICAGYHHAHALFRERYDGQLPEELMVICDQLEARIEGWVGRNLPNPCLVHGDFRLDNMMFDIGGGAEPMAVVDWQTVAVGCAMSDIGYFMGCGIGSALRRAHEDELLDLYASEMTRRGVPETRASLWNRYRIGALHGVFTAVFSAAFVVRTPRGDANFLSMARGACELALDHDSVGALDHYLETGQC